MIGFDHWLTCHERLGDHSGIGFVRDNLEFPFLGIFFCLFGLGVGLSLGSDGFESLDFVVGRVQIPKVRRQAVFVKPRFSLF